MMELPESVLSCDATINVTVTVTGHGFTSKPITETLTYKCELIISFYMHVFMVLKKLSSFIYVHYYISKRDRDTV